MENSLVPQWILKTLGILLIVLVSVIIISQLKAIYGNHQTMNISAQGKVTSVPDLATVRIGVITEGTSAIDVKDKNNKKINQLISFIKQEGVHKDNIQTSDFHASPKYNYTNGQSNIIGYQANQIMTVKFLDIDKSRSQLEKILDGAANNGANQIQGVDFSFSNPENLKKQARKLAIENAKEKAVEISTQANLHLGNVINIIESGNSSNQSPYPMAMSFSREKSVAPDIQPGTQDIIENITLVFEVN